MRLEAALQGNLKDIMKQEISAAETAVSSGVKEVTNGIKTDLRDQVVSSGLGQKVANAWRSKFYPSGKSINQAGYIFTKVPEIISGFSSGVVIKSRKGLFLAIATSAAPARGNDGKRINPTNFPESTYGKLEFVYRPGAVSLLVVNNVRARAGKRGGFAKASATALRTGRGLSSAIMFFLVPQVSLKKRLDMDRVTNKWDNALAERILANWPEEKSS